MGARKMHADEVETDVPLVRRLLAAQFPRWADLPIGPVPSAGTDNALYRLGEEMVVRLPRIHWAVGLVEKEQEWLPRLAPHLPLSVPVPLAMGKPAEGFPRPWSVYRWLEGENATADRIGDLREAAADLAHFITDLQRIDPTGGPPSGPANFFRGVPLAARDAGVRAAIAAWEGMVDTGALTAAWDAALQAPVWHGPPVWIHGDLSSGNLLVQRGRLSAVIDFGCLGVGDPAADLIVAWTLFSGESRDVFRAALRVDDATWARGRGWALTRVGALPYYRDTNPVLVASARHAIDEVLAEHRSTV
jgi:aminoglycoside phosphotransferase (APT) family kinase protein